MEGREANGRFTPGHGVKGGRRPRADENDICAALSACKPQPQVMAKLAAAIDQGEQWAITLYLAYMWGKPRERIDLDAQTYTVLITEEIVHARVAPEDTAIPDASGVLSQ